MDGEGTPNRGSIVTTDEVLNASSLGELLSRTVEAHGERPVHLRRQKGGVYTPVSYTKFYDEVFAMAKALESFGAQRGDKFCIMAESSPEWTIIDWAGLTLGLVLVPIYPTLPADQAQFIVEDCEAKFAIAGSESLAERMTGVPIEIMGQTLLNRGGSSNLTTDTWHARTDETSIDDIATIIYTSGTTGNPKGVMLKHAAFLANCKGARSTLRVDDTDTFLSFLPMAHVFERFGNIFAVSVGACTANVGTLASMGADMVKVSPTIMLTVPRFLESMQARIMDGVRKQSPVKQKLFHAALKSGLQKADGKSAPLHGLLDKLVGSKIRERTGGRLRFFVSGGAALPPHVGEFYIAFGLPALQGYGLTETCAASTINRPQTNRPSTVGSPIEGVELKLAADGEILIRGASVMTGYYNLPEATAEALDTDGWFATGDIGEMDAGDLKITDRKKDILVLANGKNIAPQPIAGLIKESPYISEVVIFGDGCTSCCALIVPQFDAVTAWLKSNDIECSDKSEMVAREDVKQLIKAEVKAANDKLADYQKIKKHALVDREFTVDSGELTPSMKVKRKVVQGTCADLLAPMLD